MMEEMISRLKRDVEALREAEFVTYYAKDKDQLADDIEAVLESLNNQQPKKR